tara:strand:- start:313 stop:534 length:222 start_codon:yes stop_codon:yes gene_type:complete
LTKQIWGCKNPLSFFRGKQMPQIGNDKNPIIMNGFKKKKSTRILGMLANAYSGEAKKNYQDNYDKIFSKKKKG